MLRLKKNFILFFCIFPVYPHLVAVSLISRGHFYSHQNIIIVSYLVEREALDITSEISVSSKFERSQNVTKIPTL